MEPEAPTAVDRFDLARPRCRRWWPGWWAVVVVGAICLPVRAAALPRRPPSVLAQPVERHQEPLVRLADVDPTIFIELRYATSRNIAGRALYSREFPCLVRQSVAERLCQAQRILRAEGLSLKIWDAYRPLAAQRELFRTVGEARFVGDPGDPSRCLHTWGVAIDLTMVDARGDAVAMPTDFDVFDGHAGMDDDRRDPLARRNLERLHHALARAGFLGYRSEWWHFIAIDWQRFGPVPESLAAAALKPSLTSPRRPTDGRAPDG